MDRYETRTEISLEHWLPAPRPGPDLPGTSPHPRRLHHFFEASCDTTPDAVALECGPERFTYRQLDERANQLAHYLTGMGVRRSARVGIFLHRSPWTYVSLLAVLKAGGAFVPIDPNSPADRADFIAGDAGLELLLSTTEMRPVTAVLDAPILELDAVEPSLPSLPTYRPTIATEGDPGCYVIYTSGSTGRPKGVEVTQSSICNFIDIVPAIYGVRPSDRVYQGMTIAFDFSIEEIWPTWAVGATLIAGPNDGRRLGSGLAEFLQDTAVTMVYCVPTVLATLDRELPRIRTLNVGGEACPAELVERWSRPGRRILNTYGPTEATVTATWAELAAGRPVTIGRPLPTYSVHILDEDLRPVPDGDVGEICIGGPGVARGYVGRPDLTAERFIPNPFDPTGGRLYRTGDLGRVRPDGEIEYLGRSDSEVKVRGHRVDLQEIENVLLEDEAVRSAVVTLLSSPSDGAGELAAYVTERAPTLEAGHGGLVPRLHDALRRRLPAYMVPAFLEVVSELPMLASGKVDRSRLPAPTGGRLISMDRPHVPAQTALERDIAAVWAEVFGLQPDQLSVEADFFLDLGGHSLLAATAVSSLRQRNVGRSPSIADLYANPTVREFARAVAPAPAAQAAPAIPRPAPRRPSGLRVASCGLVQLGLLYLLLLAFGLPVAVIFSANGGEVSTSVLWQLATTVPAVYVLGRWVIPVVGTRLLTAGLRPGRYPLWGLTFLRLWAVDKLIALSPVGVLSGSPLLPGYLRLLGARIGPGAHIATGLIPLPSLTRIGEGASIGYGVQLQCWVVEDGWVTVKPVVVGAWAFVGSSAVLLPGARLGEGARLAEQSLCASEQVIPNWQHCEGSPAVPTTRVDPLLDAMERRRASASWSPRLLTAFVLATVAIDMLLPVAAVAPVVGLVWYWLLNDGVLAGLLATLLSGPLYVMTVCTLVASAKRIVLPSTQGGIHPLQSERGFRKWCVDKLLEASLAWTNSLYATLYTVPWLRVLGGRIGALAEVSTAAHLDPDLLDLAPESFIADMASVGSAVHCAGSMYLGRTHVGHRAFVGNAAVVRSGTRLGEGSLIGVQTVPPLAGVPAGTSWLGSPAIFLPRRQESQAFEDDRTFRPPLWILLERLIIEFFRITVPSALIATEVYLVLLGTSVVAARSSLPAVVVTVPALMLLGGLAAVLTVAALKWAIVGRYRPRVEPLWSRFVRRTELVTGLYETAAVPALLAGLTGTPLLGPLLRLFGAQVGRRTWIATTYLTEFDLVELGDDVAVGINASLQTHLFEDRVMKMSAVRVKSGASIGTRSIVLYDAVIGRDTALDGLSLVMKGERLQPATRWRGIPSQAVE